MLIKHTNRNKTCFCFKSENVFQNLPQIHAKFKFVLLCVKTLTLPQYPTASGESRKGNGVDKIKGSTVL